MPSLETIHIFFAADHKFEVHLGVAITSVVMSAPDKGQLFFHVLDGGVSQTSKMKLRELTGGQIEFLLVDDALFESFPITEELRHTSKGSYYRYLIPALRPDLEKALYLDCDLIVRKPLNELWLTDIENVYVAACEDTWLLTVIDWKSKLGLAQDSFYFNAGVMLMNLEKMRDDNLSQKLFVRTSQIAGRMKYQDQDVLNLVLEKKVLLLPLKWNVQKTAFSETGSIAYSEEELEGARLDPAIVHFAGPIKPWQYGCRHPWRREYLSYLKRSLWKETRWRFLLPRWVNLKLILRGIKRRVGKRG